MILKILRLGRALAAAGSPENLHFFGLAHGRAPAVHAQLVEDVPRVGTNRVERYRQFAGDLRTAEVGAEQAKDVGFAVAQGFDEVRVTSACLALMPCS